MTGGLRPAWLAHAIEGGFNLGGRWLPAWRPTVRCASWLFPLRTGAWKAGCQPAGRTYAAPVAHLRKRVKEF